MRRREREYRAAHATHVEHLAYHDGLTGLPNRAFLGKLLDDRIRQSSRYGRRFALLFLDLDGFKQINDTLGHDAGDDLLREVANRLEDGLRKSDTVARMGGDEFMVLLPELESELQAGTAAANIIAVLSEPFVLLGEKFRVSASVGISVFPNDGEDEQTLMKNADIAMYAAKDAGKNAFRYFSADMSRASQERINLESGVRRALAHDEFELHYQARRDLRTGRITGMEALLRWNHPEYGTIGPNKFLPLAEETGLIVLIGRWVLRTACRQNREWREKGLRRLSVAVNLSARQFFDPGLTADITSILEETGMPADLLELEISESVLARDTKKTLPVLQRLKKLGLRITVDNFGTSYSALSVLGELPLDTIKIDRLFMREDAGNTAARAVINGILAMGRVLSPSVIAHGVETKEQVDFLRAQVCDQVQGFYFGRPFRASDIDEVMRTEESILDSSTANV
jgi:diguanylate cyclase (GGDEF)-like protein